jgi:hypothetical protein
MLLLLVDVGGALVAAVFGAVAACWLWDLLRPRRR